jgi:hypothetical protein
MFPQLLKDTLSAGRWCDPGPEMLKKILGIDQQESDLLLFWSQSMMERIKGDLDRGGYVDAPQFCMVRSRSDHMGDKDPRLVYDDALFFGGSNFPGDDGLLAIDMSKPEYEQHVLWLDWSRSPPERWTSLVPLAVFIERLDQLSVLGRIPPS